MQQGQSEVESFRRFVIDSEPKLRQALSATLGSQAGHDATAHSLAYGWEHWGRVSGMENPVGYLFTIGRNSGRRWSRQRRPVFYDAPVDDAPWVEPGLPDALSELSERQRVVVMLLHCFGWSMTEVAELLGVSKSTVQNHAERGLATLRTSMGVPL